MFKEFCLKLCRATSEQEVEKIIKDMEVKLNIIWKPYGGTKGNFSSFVYLSSEIETKMSSKSDPL